MPCTVRNLNGKGEGMAVSGHGRITWSVSCAPSRTLILEDVTARAAVLYLKSGKPCNTSS